MENEVKRGRRAVVATVMLAVVLMTVGCDQASKRIARTYLEDGSSRSLLGGALVLRYVENQGAFLSLGSVLPRPVRRILFVAIPLCLIAGIIVYAAGRRSLRAMLAAGLSLVAGGGAGNLLDRILHDGRVGDFLLIDVAGIRTGIFNLADLSIVLGCLLLLIGRAKPGPRIFECIVRKRRSRRA